MAKSKVNKEVSLEDALWECRVALRGVGTMEKNRDAVIGLCFLKFAGDKFEKRREELITQYGNIPAFLESVPFYNAANVFYLTEEARWSFLKKHAGDNGIAKILDDAMDSIEKQNPSLAGALPQGLYVSLAASPDKLKTLIDSINNITTERFHEEDLIGRVYEYFLRLYAASGTKEDGEFYTPASVVKLIAELIEPYDGKVYDPCCGSGGMFVQSMKFVDVHKGNRLNVSVYGQESQPETWRLCKMNLSIRGIASNLGEKPASTFTEDQHKGLKADYIMANPPFNLKDWRAEDKLLNDDRWSGYTVPRVANANYAWILHMISKLDTSKGIAGFLLANGALNDADEYENRKQLIMNDKIEAIIVLPRDMFYTTDISVTLWIINMNKNSCVVNGRHLRDRTHEILFMDLRNWDTTIEEVTIDKGKKKKKTALSDEQIAKVKNIYNSWQSADTSLYKDIPELCKSVSLKGEGGLEEKDFTLTPSKYIDFVDHDLDVNYEQEMLKIQQSMKLIVKEEEKAQIMLKKAFKGIGYGIE